MLAVRSAWAAGEPAEVLVRSGRKHFGLMADDHRAQHFGLFVNGRLRAYARCAPFSGNGWNRASTRENKPVLHVLDMLQAHPQLLLNEAARSIMMDTIRCSLRTMDGWLCEHAHTTTFPLNACAPRTGIHAAPLSREQFW